MNQDNFNEDNGSFSSFIKKIILKFKSIPVAMRSSLLVAIGYIATIFMIIFGVIILILAAAGLAEELFSAIKEAGNKVTEFFTKAGNFFAGDGFVSDKVAAEKAEKGFYEQLNKIYDTYNKDPYNVEIDITMITATLFYGRTMGDYEGDAVDADFDSDDIFGTSYDDTKDFYKQAKKSINTLAKYQLVKRHTVNNCVDNEADVKYESDYSSAKEFAELGSNGTVETTNSILYNENSVVSCPYEDVTSSMISAFTADKRIYNNAQISVNNCMSATSGSSSACSTALSNLNTARETYQTWITDGLFDSDGNFTCTNSSTYGVLMLDESGRCVQKEANSFSYTTDISQEGVYYYRLLSNIDFGRSFIEKYYYPLETVDDEILYETVDGIYSLYRSLADRTNNYCYTPSTSTGSYASESREEFFNQIAEEVVTNMSNTGILSSLTLAQASLESGNGQSLLTSQYHNYYGMTAGSCAPPALSTTSPTLVRTNSNGNSCTGNAFWNGDIVWMCNNGSDCQWYRVYDGFSNSTYDHSRLLSSDYYGCQGQSTPEAAVACVVSHGYATDENYASKVLSIIYDNDLTQYDIGTWDGEVVGNYGLDSLGTLCYTNSSSSGGSTITNGVGTVTSASGFIKRVSLSRSERTPFWTSYNTLYTSGYEGQCTWYAFGRGLEILTDNGMSTISARTYMAPLIGHAYKWYRLNNSFSSSTNINEPKVGAIIVWGNNISGHVAVVEELVKDASGRITGVYYSEGNTGSSNYGGFRYSYKTIDQLSSVRGGGGKYSFIGYIYLLS